jgi:alkylation response protein AidB-like acyl-CoA dehydrogenase
MVSILDLRKKYLGAVAATDEDMQIVRAVREFVDGEIMPHRQDLDGGWHRDETLAKQTFKKIHQGLVDIGVQRAAWPEALGGLGISDVANDMISEELSRGDAGIATHMGIINWVMLAAAWHLPSPRVVQIRKIQPYMDEPFKPSQSYTGMNGSSTGIKSGPAVPV